MIAVGTCSGIQTLNKNGAYNQTTRNGDEGFIIEWKENSSNEKILYWGTYYGGSETDRILSVDVNPVNSDLLICGVTNTEVNASNSNIANSTGKFPFFYSGSQFHNQHDNAYDYFLATFNSQRELTWASYFGSNRQDGYFPFIYSIANQQFGGRAVYDQVGNIILAGTVYSEFSSNPSLPTANLTGAYNQDYINGNINSFSNYFNGDAFIALFKSQELAWSTFYGGDESNISTGVWRYNPFSLETDVDIITIPNKNNFYLSLRSNSVTTPGDCIGAKYCQNYLEGSRDATITLFEYNPDNTAVGIKNDSQEKDRHYIFYSDNGQLNIQFENYAARNFIIYSMLGQKILSGKLNQRYNQILIKQFAPGTYILNILDEKNQYSEKFLVD